MLESVIKNIPQLSGIPYSKITIQTLSGLTNKNYFLSTADNQTILRTPRKSTNTFINRNDEAHNAEIAEQLGLSPKNLWRETNKNKEFTGASLTTYISDSHTINSDDFKNPQTLKKLATTLAKLHNSKKAFKGVLDNQKIAKHLSLYFDLCSTEQQQSLDSDFKKTLRLLNEIKNDRPAVPSHIDLMKENILIQGEKIWLIDWEYSAMASPFWDIATLCNSAEFSEEEAQSFSKKVLINFQEDDFKCLKKYQIIVKSISNCWQAAFNK